MANTSVIIIGLGLSGPALALSLRRLNITCTIYELRPKMSTTLGGAINLSPNALRILDHWGLYAHVAELGFAHKDIEMWSLASGKALGRLPLGGRERFG